MYICTCEGSVATHTAYACGRHRRPCTQCDTYTCTCTVRTHTHTHTQQNTNTMCKVTHTHTHTRITHKDVCRPLSSPFSFAHLDTCMAREPRTRTGSPPLLVDMSTDTHVCTANDKLHTWCTQTHTYAYKHIYTHIYIYTHIDIHTYAHTDTNCY